MSAFGRAWLNLTTFRCIPTSRSAVFTASYQCLRHIDDWQVPCCYRGVFLYETVSDYYEQSDSRRFITVGSAGSDQLCFRARSAVHSAPRRPAKRYGINRRMEARRRTAKYIADTERLVESNYSPDRNVDPNAQQSPEPDNQPAYPVPAPLTIKPGTFITVRLNETLSSDKSHVGDSFTASLARPIVVDGVVAAQPGETIGGRVTNAEKAGRVQGVIQLAFS